MEPFRLTFHQVNYEEKDLSPTQKLDAFSNVVSYDFDDLTLKLEEETEEANNNILAIASERIQNTSAVKKPECPTPQEQNCELDLEDKGKVNQTSKPEIPQHIAISTAKYYQEPPVQSSTYEHPDVFSTCHVNEQDKTDIEKAHVKLKPHTSFDGLELDLFHSKQKHSMSSVELKRQRSSSAGDNSDSFTAFTTATEALALQRSVIGTSDVTPASPEVVAQLIEQQYKSRIQTEGDKTHGQGEVVISNEANQSHTEDIHTDPKLGQQQSHLSSPSVNHSQHHSPSIKHQVYRKPVKIHHTHMESPDQKSLIRVPPENITITKTRTGFTTEHVTVHEVSPTKPKCVTPLKGGGFQTNALTRIAPMIDEMRNTSTTENGKPSSEDEKESVRHKMIWTDQNTGSQNGDSVDLDNLKVDSRHMENTVQTNTKEVVDLETDLKKNHSSSYIESYQADINQSPVMFVNPLPDFEDGLVTPTNEIENQFDSTNQHSGQQSGFENGDLAHSNADNVNQSSPGSAFRPFVTTHPDQYYKTDHSPPVKDMGFQPIMSKAGVNGASNAAMTGLAQSDTCSRIPDRDSLDSGIDIAQMEKGAAVDYNAGPVETSTPLRHSTNGHAYNSQINMVAMASPSVVSNQHGYHDGSSNYVSTFMGNGFQGQDYHNQSAASETSFDERSVSRASSVTSSIMTESMSFDLEQVLREKANLEGQLEMVSLEARNAVRDRAEIQAQMSALKAQLSAQTTSSMGKSQQDLIVELQTAHKTSAMLREKVANLEKELEEKGNENESVQDDLKVAQDLNDKLHGKIDLLRKDIQDKESTTQALKNKIAELYVEMQTAVQAKMQVENEVKALNADIESHQKAKEWYLQQFHCAQDARASLQAEVSKLQLTTVQQGNLVEKLKTENTRIHTELRDIQQKVLYEKEQLAHHLEAIQVDMMEREAMFEQMRVEHATKENEIQIKMAEIEKERLRLNSAVNNVTDLEHELRKSQNLLKQRDAQVAVLEHQQAELMKRLTLSQESLAERDAIVDSLQQNCIGVETRLKGLQVAKGSKEEEFLNLKADNTKLQVQLAAALEDKKTFDSSVQTLKNDLGRIEQSFRQMKQDLEKKDKELKTVMEEKIDLQTELEKVKRQINDHEHNQRQLNSDSTMRNVLVEELKSHKQALQTEVATLRNELQLERNKHQMAGHEKSSVEEDLNDLNDKYAKMEKMYETELAEKTHLEGKLEFLTSEQQSSSQLAKDNANLKAQMAELETCYKNEIQKLMNQLNLVEDDRNRHKAEVSEKQKTSESSIGVLTKKLKETNTAKMALEQEVSILKRRVGQSHTEIAGTQEELQRQIENLRLELDTVKSRKQMLEIEIGELHRSTEVIVQDYKSKIVGLERELKKSRETGKKYHKSGAARRKLALELEKEKGRLAGVLQSHDSLKQHTSTLEEALARRDTSISELSSTAQSELLRKGQSEVEYRKRVEDLEAALNKEKETVKQVKKQMMVQKGENVKLRRSVETIQLDVDQLQQDLEDSKNIINALKLDLDKAKKTEIQYKMDVETMNTQYISSKMEIERLKRELKDSSAKDPVMEEQIKTLTWQLDQRTKELEGVQEQFGLINERQQLELTTAQNSVKAFKTELESLKKELTSVKKDKFSFQAKVSELRGALKSSLHQNKLLKAQKSDHLPNPSPDSGDVRPTSPPPADLMSEAPAQYDFSSVEKLLNETAPATLQSRPLDNITSCLFSLRSDMTNLQKQIEVHTEAVQSSSLSWREVEVQVRELRQVCRTPVSSPLTVSQSSLETSSKPLSDDQTSAASSNTTNQPAAAASIQGMIDV